jgi:hypothetical protein
VYSHKKGSVKPLAGEGFVVQTCSMSSVIVSVSPNSIVWIRWP